MIRNLDMTYAPGGRADLRLPGGRVSIRGIGGPAPSETRGVVFLKQVHGAEVLRDPSGGEAADGLLLSDELRSPGLRVADCLPVLLLGRGYTAAFHAGWRGLAAGIQGRMAAMLPAPPDWVLLGPCICPACYTVGPDVRRAVLEGLPEEGHPPGGLDLARAALDGMLAAGLAPETPILRVPECTRCRRDLFHSHRADGTAERNLIWVTVTTVRDPEEVAPLAEVGHIHTSDNSVSNHGTTCRTYNCNEPPARRD